MFLNHFQSFYAMSFCLICGQLAQLQLKCEYQAQLQTNHCLSFLLLHWQQASPNSDQIATLSILQFYRNEEDKYMRICHSNRKPQFKLFGPQ